MIALSYSLSLHENQDLYIEGWLRNADVARRIYPGARLILHHDESVPSALTELADSAVLWPRASSAACMFWRFTSTVLPEYEAVLVRDIDSVPTRREANAVAEWLASPYKLHTMHDHPCHEGARVMGGMWGAKPGAFPYDFDYLVRWWVQHKGPFEKGADQWFLSRYVYPYAERDGLNHWGTSYPKALTAVPFPDGPSPTTGFVGEIINL